MIPLDFVAGTHGHFVEYVLNCSFGYSVQDFDPFTDIGTSHHKSQAYLDSRQIICDHWFEHQISCLTQASHVIRIVFDIDDVLWVTGSSLFRAGNYKIDDDQLHEHTRSKLSNAGYHDTLKQIYEAYDFLDVHDGSIPRNVLREFFKFGFRDPNINGYWMKLQDMLSVPVVNQYQIRLQNIYDQQKFCCDIHNIADWLGVRCHIGAWLAPLHDKFLFKLGNLSVKQQCDDIILAVLNKENIDIPHLSLLQESYVNGKLEQLFQKEMPFYQNNYFTNTRDIVQYIEYQGCDI